MELHDDLRNRIPRMTRSQYATLAVDWVFERPVFAGTAFVQEAGIPESTARRLLTVLRKGGVLRELVPAAGRKAALWLFPELLNLAEGRRAF